MLSNYNLKTHLFPLLLYLYFDKIILLFTLFLYPILYSHQPGGDMILQKLKNLIFSKEENIMEIQIPIVSKMENSTPSILSLFSPSILLHIQQEGVEYNITRLLNSFNEQLLIETKKGNFIVNFSHDEPNPKDIIALQLIQKQLRNDGFKTRLGDVQSLNNGGSYAWTEITFCVTTPNPDYTKLSNQVERFKSKDNNIGISALSSANMLENHYQQVNIKKIKLLHDIYMTLEADNKKGHDVSIFTKEDPTQADLAALKLISSELKNKGFKIELSDIELGDNVGSYGWTEISMRIINPMNKKIKMNI